MNEHKLYNDIERIVLNWRGFESDNEFTSAIFDEVNKHFAELETENLKLREALKPFAETANEVVSNDDLLYLVPYRGDTLHRARAALGEIDDN